MLSESPGHMLRPFITLEGEAQSALDLYEEVFPDFALHALTHHAAPHDGLIMTAKFEVKGQAMMISDSFISHEWSITPGISFFIDLEGEAELNRLAAALAEGGMVHMSAGNYGFSTLFAWVQDRFGVNWQLNVA